MKYSRRLIIGFSLALSVCSEGFSIPLSVSGNVFANAVNASGDLTVSSMTVSTMTVSSLLQLNGKTGGIHGIVVQTLISVTSSSSTTTSTTLVPIPGLTATISLSNPNNYVRIALTGSLETSNYYQEANVSLERDSINLGSGGFAAAYNFPGATSVGIVIVDSPGDTNPHTYNATFSVSSSSETATFSVYPSGYLLVQEIAK